MKKKLTFKVQVTRPTEGIPLLIDAKNSREAVKTVESTTEGFAKVVGIVTEINPDLCKAHLHRMLRPGHSTKGSLGQT